MNKQRVILLICDGLGYREEKEHNAVFQANTPNLDRYYRDYPFALLAASGKDIGLPENQMGTSEANHLVIGAGRVIYQNLVKINNAIENNLLADNQVLLDTFGHVKKHQSALHIKGIISDGGVHGHIEHLKAIHGAAKNQGIDNIYFHLFTDGRDTAPKSAIKYVNQLQQYLDQEGSGRIATIGGRYWGMDRDNNRERVEKHFAAMTKGDGPRFNSAREVIEHSYNQEITDEFIEPAVIVDPNEQLKTISANDAVIFANFRSDRAKQIAERFLEEKIENLKYVTMTKYADDLNLPAIFGDEKIDNTLSDVIANHDLKQLKVTETEKFAHLTFFFNAQKYEAAKGEDRILIESNKDVATHDEKPEMKIAEIKTKIIEAINDGKHDFLAANLTNCDMVGHSGNFPAIVHAVEEVDKALGEIVAAAQENGYAVIITADHGNAEQTFDSASGQALTAHTLNPVPFILISKDVKLFNRKRGDLSDIAPTVLKLMAIEQPNEMTGRSFV